MWEELKDWAGWIVAIFGTIGGHLVGNATALNSKVQALAQIIDELKKEIDRLSEKAAQVDELLEENKELKGRVKHLEEKLSSGLSDT